MECRIGPEGERVLVSAEAQAGSPERLGVPRIKKSPELRDISITGRVAWKDVARRGMQVDLPEAGRQGLQ